MSEKYMELPHDDAMERGLFTILLFTERFEDVADELTPDDFYVETHKQIFQAMLDLFSSGKPVDLSNLRLALKAKDVNPTQALSVIAEAFDDDVRQHHLYDYIKEIKNMSMLRQIVRMSRSHAYTGQLRTTNAQELLGTIEKDTIDLVEKAKDQQATNANEIVQAVNVDLEKGAKEGWHIFDSGFSKLDDSTGGFVPSHVWIIGAYTGVGKTFLILQLLLNVLRQGGRVMLFSNEMDKKLNMLRLVGNIAELGTIQIMRNRLVDHQIEAMRNALKELAEYKDRLLIYDNINTVEQIRLKIKKAQLSGEVNLVAIDYIQNLKGTGTIYERMSNAATEIYRMAQELKPTFLVGSQVSQDAAGYKSKESIDFKGAGEIAAVADVALWIKKGEGGDREILMRKVRHGTPGKAYAKLEFPSGRFIDTDKPTTQQNDIKDQL